MGTLRRALSLIARVETVQVHDHEAHFLRRQASKRQTKPTRQSARLAFRALKALRGAAPK
jgi:hypothetical protein